MIVNPIEGRVEEADEPFTVDGTATATSGVQRVEVMVRERDTNQYLQDNLTTWSNTSNTINADPRVARCHVDRTGRCPADDLGQPPDPAVLPHVREQRQQ